MVLSAIKLLVTRGLRWHRIKLAYLRGMRPDELEQLVRLCWCEVLQHHVYVSAVEDINGLRRMGYRQVLLSGTIYPLAKVLADELLLPDIIAAEPEIIDHRYTGSLIRPHPHGKWKVRYAEAWLEAKGLDWSTVTAVADHRDDYPLLERAARAVVVCPQQGVSSARVRKGWVSVSPLQRGRLSEVLAGADKP
ncbi:MAG: hypothetical protein D6800_12490 [Candidatus Zixiibacteriota bacterium]|nr:MAG: hypothetical protein D6800_12490 [candidate division Zixibacteria bacterium]